MQNKPVIVALDYDDLAAARALVAQLDPSRCRVKVGKEMFTLFGPQWVRELVDGGFDVFLDLKFHDIPNTVAKAVSAAAQLGVWMVNVHASGGVPMMQAAVKALSAFEKRPLLTAVTVLTSMDENTLSELGVNKPLLAQVEHLASLAQQAGVDGVVCSAQEAQQLKAKLGNEFLLVTPGVRPAFAEKGDQHRIMTPKAALTAGADYLVIGRPITQAAQPAQALQLIEEEIAS